MAVAICAISNLRLDIPYLAINLASKQGYFHPIFMLKQKQLWPLYIKHCAGALNNTESYLVFLAILHSTDKVKWGTPVSLASASASTAKFIAGNIKQLVDVVQLTNSIQHPSFNQPTFVINNSNSELREIKNWIAAWHRNIDLFREGRTGAKAQESLQKTENRLSYLIKSDVELSKYPQVVAAWADKAAGFPSDKAESWCAIIRASFSPAKMFNTSLADLRAIKEFCETSIPSGSIHSHALYEVLREGISRHTDYLGMNPIALGYTLLDEDTSKHDATVESIKALAPKEEPKKEDYPSLGAYIKDKSAWLTKKFSHLNPPTTTFAKGSETQKTHSAEIVISEAAHKEL